MLPWLSLLDKAMEQYEMIVHDTNSKDHLPVQCPGNLLTMQEMVAACKKKAIDGLDIALDAVSLAVEARNSAKFLSLIHI